MADDKDKDPRDFDLEEIQEDPAEEEEGGEPRPGGKDIERTDEEGGEEPREPGDEDEDASISIEVADGGSCRKTVTVTIPAETVDREIQKNMDSIKTSVPVRGFRRGKIPKGLLVRRFGTKVRDEVRSSLVSRGILKALKRDDIDSLAFPEVDETALALEEGKPLSYTFVVDVKPVLNLGDYVGIAVEKPSTAVSEKDVDDHIEGLRKEMATIEPVTDGAAEPGDHLVATLKYMLGKNVVHSRENISLQLPDDSGSETYKTAPWIAGILGKKAGEVVETEYKFPSDFPAKKARGKTGSMEVRIEDVKRRRIPEAGEEFLKAVKAADMAELRKKVAESLKSIKEGAARLVVERRVMQKLLDSVNMDLPEKVIENSLDSQAGKAELKLKQAGIPDEEIKTRVEEFRKSRREDIQSELKALFVTEEIARREKIHVTEDEVKARIELIAYKYGKWPQQVEAELEEQGMLGDLRANIREEKVLSFLREKAKVTEAAGGPAPAVGAEGGQGA